MGVSLFRVVLIVKVILETILQTVALERQAFLYISRGERKVKDNYLVEQHVLRSKIECMTKCTLRSGCSGVSWTSLGNKCLLTHGNTGTQGENNIRFVAAANWEAMIKVIYPVAHYAGPSGTYTLTFIEAKSLCEQLNTSIASWADLVYAHSLGYQVCACGWMSDEISGLVMQEYHPLCGGPFRICGGTRSNVYCLVPEYFYPSS